MIQLIQYNKVTIYKCKHIRNQYNTWLGPMGINTEEKLSESKEPKNPSQSYIVFCEMSSVLPREWLINLDQYSFVLVIAKCLSELLHQLSSFLRHLPQRPRHCPSP